MQFAEKMHGGILHLSEVGKLLSDEHPAEVDRPVFGKGKVVVMKPVGLPEQPFHAVAIDGVAEPFLRHDESDLAGGLARGLEDAVEAFMG